MPETPERYFFTGVQLGLQIFLKFNSFGNINESLEVIMSTIFIRIR